MSTTLSTQELHNALFADENTSAYAVLDGASIIDLLPQLNELGAQHQCLFAGKLHPEVVQTAPYLVALEGDHPFTTWVLQNGWGKHWGIFAMAPADLHFRDVRKHLRTFLRVRSPEGAPLFFRYYDPRVLPVFLPTCDGSERAQIFGPLSAFIMEGDDDELLQFRGETASQTAGEQSP
jgi:hypothetical protein